MRASIARPLPSLLVIAAIATACSGDGGQADGQRTGATGAIGATAPTSEDDNATTAPETAPAPFLLDLATGRETPLPEHLSQGVVYVASPDGTLIAYSTYRALYGSEDDVMSIANIDGTGARAIAVPGDLNGYVNEWSPDGTQLLYQGREGATKDLGNLFLYDLAADRSAQLTDLRLPEAAWYEIHTDFSPDGREVLFHVPRTADATDPKFDIWSVPVRGGEARVVVRDAAFPMVVSGGEVAFVVPEPGGFYGPQIAIVSADGSRRTLLVAHEAIYLPRESPDGTMIAYANGGSIFLVDVATGEISEVAAGQGVEWVDDDTLIVRP